MMIFSKRWEENGMKILHAYRPLRNEVGGSSLLGFSEGDAYENVTNEVKKTSNGLMSII